MFADMEEYRRKSRFLYGESMGGAVALLLHRKDPTFWDGAVLAAPMCKVADQPELNFLLQLPAWLKCELFILAWWCRYQRR
jgi:alpha-beta hydrolase superfamily lysophospholipase